MLQFYPETIGVIPLKDSLRHDAFPWATTFLAAVTAAVFAADRWMSTVREVPVSASTGLVDLPVRVGGLCGRFALVPEAFARDPAAHLPTLLTAIALHTNWLHAGVNVLYLWLFGRGLEAVLRARTVLLLYVGGGVAGNLAQVYGGGLSETPVVGATGAVAALIGAHLAACAGVSLRSFVPIVFTGALLDTPPLLAAGFWLLVHLANAHLFRAGDFVYGGGVAIYALGTGAAIGLTFGLISRRQVQERLADLRVDY